MVFFFSSLKPFQGPRKPGAKCRAWRPAEPGGCGQGWEKPATVRPLVHPLKDSRVTPCPCLPPRSGLVATVRPTWMPPSCPARWGWVQGADCLHPGMPRSRVFQGRACVLARPGCPFSGHKVELPGVPRHHLPQSALAGEGGVQNWSWDSNVDTQYGIQPPAGPGQAPTPLELNCEWCPRAFWSVSRCQSHRVSVVCHTQSHRMCPGTSWATRHCLRVTGDSPATQYLAGEGTVALQPNQRPWLGEEECLSSWCSSRCPEGLSLPSMSSYVHLHVIPSRPGETP